MEGKLNKIKFFDHGHVFNTKERCFDNICLNLSLFHRLSIKSFLGLLRLGDEVIGFSNFHHEVVVREHVLLDLLNWELDQHTGDLRNSLVSDEVLDEWEDGFTDSLLQVRVLL